MMQKRRILVAMSGGVDSSTAAAILKQQGHEVIGVGLRLPALLPGEPSPRSCCGIEGMDDARRVADRIGIPFYALDYRQFFEESVIGPFCRSYLEGKTPNPCIECNRVVKFGRLLALAEAMGADSIATGHYARIVSEPGAGRCFLKKGLDPERDQSYFLYPLTQQQLARILFPLGEMTKEQTRQQAKSFDLAVSDKPASQDICFLGDGDYRQLLAQRYPDLIRPGPVVDSQGQTLGQHRGIGFCTVGQRRGLGIAAGEPLYVLAVHSGTSTVVVGRRKELETSRVMVRQVNWLLFDQPPQPLSLSVKLRYRQPGLPATVCPAENGRAVVSFDTPQAAAAPGQSAVFYDGDVVVGGGIIE